MFVAAEMQRRNIVKPLLIGGATTSPAHTAVKIDPVYDKAPIVHVLDASRAVPVVGQLLSDETYQSYWDDVQANHARIRERRAGGKNQATFANRSSAPSKLSKSTGLIINRLSL